MCKIMMISPESFFIFFKILIFCVFLVGVGGVGGWGLKGQKVTHNYQFQSVTHYISRTVDRIKIFGTQV